MQFKDIQPLQPVHILNKQDMTYIKGKVTNKGFPRMPSNFKPGQNTMVVDVTIEADGKTATYEIPENLSITYANNLVLSTDSAGLIGEVESMKNTAEQILQSVEQQQKILDKSKELLAELNPAFKDKRETDERLSKMETSIKKMEEMLTRFVQSGGNGGNGNNPGNRK